MKNNYIKPLVYAVALLIPQTTAFLIDNSQGTAFFFSLVALLVYELHEKTVNIKEALLGITSFAVTGLIISVAAKALIYDNLCEISRNATSSGMKSIMTSQNTCLSVLEIWMQNISANPIKTWYFWAANVAVAVASVYLYRTYSEANE